MNILCKRIEEDAKLPSRKHVTDAGIDVYSLKRVMIKPHTFEVIKTGVTFDFPDDTVAFVWPKSRAGFLIGAGVIDHTYQGEVLVKVFNLYNKPMVIKKHEGIAQIVITPVLTPHIIEVDEIHTVKSQRGDTGGIAGNS